MANGELVKNLCFIWHVLQSYIAYRLRRMSKKVEPEAENKTASLCLRLEMNNLEAYV